MDFGVKNLMDNGKRFNNKSFSHDRFSRTECTDGEAKTGQEFFRKMISKQKHPARPLPLF
jgi:hypothetical protein